MPLPTSSNDRAMPRVQPRSRLRQSFSQQGEFRKICGQCTLKADYPLAEAIVRNAVVYSGDQLRSVLAGGDEEKIDESMDELHRCLLSGPGIFAIKGFYKDTSVVDRASAALQRIIEEERASGQAKGDHFAAAGTNDRIWNSFQKHAIVDPAGFVKYYSNELLALVSESWLGPGYQVTAQTNVVKPGGKAQKPHRDYHLGFQSEETASRFPIVAQIASQLLTLQGAVAHTDMPLASGPTQLLPYSQHFEYGYTAYRHPEFVAVFHELMVQVELDKGDAVFFNPALFHAAGENTTLDFNRTANLLQISACWSKPMETVDTDAIIAATWEELRKWVKRVDGGVGHPSSQALVKAIAQGYSFPSNLDRDPPPNNGHCPEPQVGLVERALQEDVDGDELALRLRAYAERHKA